MKRVIVSITTLRTMPASALFQDCPSSRKNDSGMLIAIITIQSAGTDLEASRLKNGT
jgi:hypothetical protein